MFRKAVERSIYRVVRTVCSTEQCSKMLRFLASPSALILIFNPDGSNDGDVHNSEICAVAVALPPPFICPSAIVVFLDREGSNDADRTLINKCFYYVVSRNVT